MPNVHLSVPNNLNDRHDHLIGHFISCLVFLATFSTPIHHYLYNKDSKNQHNTKAQNFAVCWCKLPCK